MGIRFLSDAGRAIDALGADDVVILPAFGVTVAMLQQLDARGCTLVDTTCGSVLNVWKNVRRYAEGGYTSVIHGKVWHEETQATASQAVAVRRPLPRRVRSTPKPQTVCDYIRARRRPRRVPGAVRQGGVAGLRSRSRPAAHRPRQPDDDADVRVAGDRRDAARRRCSTATATPTLGRALSGVRHDLQRHAGSPGRRRRAAARHSRST